MLNLGWILANQVAPGFLNGSGDGSGSTFQRWLAQTDDAFVGMHFMKRLTWFDEASLWFGYFYVVVLLKNRDRYGSLSINKFSRYHRLIAAV